MTRGLNGRMGRIERAMGIDPVKAELLHRDAETERQAALAFEEDMFKAKVYAHGAMRALPPFTERELTDPDARMRAHPRSQPVMPADLPDALREIRRLADEDEPTWERHMERLLEEAVDPTTISSISDFGRRARRYMQECVAEIRRQVV